MAFVFDVLRTCPKQSLFWTFEKASKPCFGILLAFIVKARKNPRFGKKFLPLFDFQTFVLPVSYFFDCKDKIQPMSVFKSQFLAHFILAQRKILTLYWWDVLCLSLDTRLNVKIIEESWKIKVLYKTLLVLAFVWHLSGICLAFIDNI